MTSKDPLFVHDLARKTRTGERTLPPLPKHLVRRSLPNHFKLGAKRSTFLHLSVLVIVLLQGAYNRFFITDEERKARLRMEMGKSSIRVDIVDLPSLKFQDLAKVDALEKPGAALPPPPAAKPVELPPKPSDKAMIDRTKPQPKETKGKEKLSAADRLKALRDSLRADNRRKELMKKFKIDGEGERAPLAGNVLSQGSQTTGDIATVAEEYEGKLVGHLRKNYNVPGWMRTGQLRARVLVRIGPDGRLLHQEFLKRSGNAEFDSAVERAVRSSDPFPSPPDALRRVYMEEGVEWGFPE